MESMWKYVGRCLMDKSRTVTENNAPARTVRGAATQSAFPYHEGQKVFITKACRQHGKMAVVQRVIESFGRVYVRFIYFQQRRSDQIQSGVYYPHELENWSAERERYWRHFEKKHQRPLLHHPKKKEGFIIGYEVKIIKDGKKRRCSCIANAYACLSI